MSGLRKKLALTRIFVASLALSQTACSLEILEGIFGVEDKNSAVAIGIPAVAFDSPDVPELSEVGDLTLFQLAQRTLQMTKMMVRNDEFTIDEYRYYSVQTAFEDLVHELREDINQYWTINQHLEDLEVSPMEFLLPLTADESETAWAVSEELLDLRINQIGNIAKKENDLEESKVFPPKVTVANTDDEGASCETPGKDKGLWKFRVPAEDEASKCVSHVHHLWGSVKRSSDSFIRDNACLDFAYGIRIFEQQRRLIANELDSLKNDADNRASSERGKQLRAEQAAATYGFIQNAKMYTSLLCVGNGSKPGEY